MKTHTATPGITFAVQQVERATRPLSICKTHEALMNAEVPNDKA